MVFARRKRYRSLQTDGVRTWLRSQNSMTSEVILQHDGWVLEARHGQMPFRLPILSRVIQLLDVVVVHFPPMALNKLVCIPFFPCQHPRLGRRGSENPLLTRA